MDYQVLMPLVPIDELLKSEEIDNGATDTALLDSISTLI